MITLYTYPTPNGRKVSILLEEIKMPYQLKLINISNNEQFAPEFLTVAPNNKIPAITDDEVMQDGKPLSIFESGAILTYLAEKSGQFLAKTGPDRYKAFEWLNWQMSGLGPMMGQLGFFAVRAPEKLPLAIKRFYDEVDRLLSVMDRRLAANAYLAGKDYSIADMACYPWMITATTMLKEPLGQSVSTKSAIARWMKDIAARPAVQRGMDVPKL